jgi:hypothetical protein
VSTMRIASPERGWRAAAAFVIAGVVGWAVSASIRLGARPGTSAGLPTGARIGVIGVALAIGAALAILTWQSHLAVSDDGLADHRLLRVVRVPWPLIARFEVDRPAGPWGGFCIAAVCHDATRIDLLSTRAYSRVPSERHLDELHRICWTLEEMARQRTQAG